MAVIRKEAWVKNVKIYKETSLDDNRFDLPATTSYLQIDNNSDYDVEVQFDSNKELYPLLSGCSFESPMHAIHYETLSFVSPEDVVITVLAGVYTSSGRLDW